MPARFGPFEFTDGEWVIGDPAGDHVRLRRDGLSHWVQGGEIRQMAWSRVMDIVLSVQPVRRDHSKRLRKVAVMLSWLGQPTEHVGLPASSGYVRAIPMKSGVWTSPTMRTDILDGRSPQLASCSTR